MPNLAMNPKVDFYFAKAQKWQAEMELLRAIVLDTMLQEELKWGCPCYTLNKKNVLIIHSFKEYCAILFIKGALLKDTKKILIQQTENVQAARHLRFTSVKEISKLKATIKAYIYEAIEVEQAGLKVALKSTTEYAIPEEFKIRLTASAPLKKAFEALTPGRKRAYLFYFGAAKQATTREQRIEKCIPQILKGIGLND